MSTVKLLKDVDGKKAGATVSVPFLRAKGLVATGFAAYPDQPADAPRPAPADTAAFTRRIAALEQENADLKSQLAAAAAAGGDVDTTAGGAGGDTTVGGAGAGTDGGRNRRK